MARFARRQLPINRPVVILLVLITFWLLLRTPLTGDWRLTFFPAGVHWLTPYEDSYHFVYPPWLAPLLAIFTPAGLLPSRALFAALSVAAAAWAMRSFGGGLTALLLLLVSPPMVTVLVRGEVDALLLLGLGLGLQTSATAQLAGIYTLALKPQIFGLAIPLIYWHSRHRRLLAGGGAALLLLSLALYGWWPGDIWGRLPDLNRTADVSVWPWGVPAGVALFLAAWWRRAPLLAAAATGLVSPYVSWYSLVGVLALLLARLPRPVGAALVVTAWVLLRWSVR